MSDSRRTNKFFSTANKVTCLIAINVLIDLDEQTFSIIFSSLLDKKYYANDNIYSCKLTADKLDNAANSIGQKVNEIMHTDEFIQEAEMLDKLKPKACLVKICGSYTHDEKYDFVVELNSVDEKDIETFINSIKNHIFLPAEKKSRRCNIL